MGDRSAIEWTDATWNPIRGCTRVSEGCRNCYAERTAIRQSHAGGAYEGLVKSVPVRVREGKGANAIASQPRWTGAIRYVEELVDQPLRWAKPRRIFVNSMSDLFHNSVADGFIDRLFAVMALASRHTFQILTKRPERMRLYFASEFRHARVVENMRELGRRIEGEWTRGQLLAAYGTTPTEWHMRENTWPLPNVHLGVSVEDQATSDERIPLLLQTPARVRWVSYEPALGPVAFKEFLGPRCETCLFSATCFGRYEDMNDTERYACDRCCGHGNEDGWCKPVSEGGITGTPRGLDWIVVGGESGPGARPFDLAWARSTVKQCRAASVPVFVKQLGARRVDSDRPGRLMAGMPEYDVKLRDRKGGDWSEWPEDLRRRELPR